MSSPTQDYGLDVSIFDVTVSDLFHPKDAIDVRAYLAILKLKSPETYWHSVRVSLLCAGIGRTIHFGETPLFYAGLLHDLGKSLVARNVLHKTEGWTPDDSTTVQTHVLDGFRLLRDRFDFTAEIVARHHRYQPNCYPDTHALPEHLHAYSNATDTIIPFYGRLLALADSFDAYHRVNSRGKLTGPEVRSKMLTGSRDMHDLIEALYDNGTFPMLKETP